jgi:hypothetical protein
MTPPTSPPEEIKFEIIIDAIKPKMEKLVFTFIGYNFISK